MLLFVLDRLAVVVVPDVNDVIALELDLVARHQARDDDGQAAESPDQLPLLDGGDGDPHALAAIISHLEHELDIHPRRNCLALFFWWQVERVWMLAVAPDARAQMPAVDDPARGRPDKTLAEALHERDLQLLDHPEWPLDPGDGMQFAEQFVAAGIIPVEGKHDHPQQGTGSESPHE